MYIEIFQVFKFKISITLLIFQNVLRTIGLQMQS